MSEKEVLLTAEGLKKLEEELEYLKTSKRREVAERIKAAIEFGDISENSEYDDAKNEQAFVEGRILTLDKQVRNARIIDITELDTSVISIGSNVTLRDLETLEDFQYSIVGSAEASAMMMKISNESPVGRALIGKKVGDTIEVIVPAGVLQYQVKNIK